MGPDFLGWQTKHHVIRLTPISTAVSGPPCLPTSPSRQTELITADAFFQASLASKQPCKQSSGLQCFSSLTLSVCLVNLCSSLSTQVRHPTSLLPLLTSSGLHTMPLHRRSLSLPASTGRHSSPLFTYHFATAGFLGGGVIVFLTLPSVPSSVLSTQEARRK